MKEECRGLERDSLLKQLTELDRREIDEKFPYLDEDARWDKYRDEDQINSRLRNLLIQNRTGLFQPQKTNTAYEPGLVGGESSQQGKRRKAASAKHNPLNGPIIRQRKQEKLRAEHALELSNIKYKGEVSLEKEGAKAKAEYVLDFHCFELIVSVHASYNLLLLLLLLLNVSEWKRKNIAMLSKS